MEEILISKELEGKIQQAETLEDIIQACAEEGIQVTKEQLKAAMMPESDGELTEDMLDNVSGGGLFGFVRKIINTYRAVNYNSGGSGFSSGGGGKGAAGGGGGGGGR